MADDLRKRDQAEVNATDAFNRVMGNILADIGFDDHHFAPRDYKPKPEGTVETYRLPNGAQLHLKKGQRPYQCYRSNDGWMFCYTSWRDENDDYWYWTYKPVGKGSQSNKAREWKLKDLKSARTRKTAQKRSLARLRKREVK